MRKNFLSYVRHADGTTDRIKLTRLSPRIYDGSKIVIIRKGDKIPFNFTEYVTNLTAIWADLTSCILDNTHSNEALILKFTELQKILESNFKTEKLSDIAHELKVTPR